MTGDAAKSPGDLDRFVGHSLRTSMYFPQSKLFVAGNPKAAGTSIRWWLLESHGVDVAGLTADSLWGESAPFQTVWDPAVDLRFTWPRLRPDEQQEALASPEVMTVHPVRHPVTRTFSAWAGKYLTREPYYEGRLPAGFDPAPDQVESADHVAELFAAFVGSLARHVAEHDDWADVDVHFWPQHRLLARTPEGPLLLLRQESMAAGLEQVEGRLRESGLTPVPLARVNENVVSYQASLVHGDTVAALADLYAADFSTWGYRAEAPAAPERGLDLAWLNDLRGRNRRFEVVHHAAVAARHRVGELESALAAAQRRERELLDSTSWRATRPLRWASERLGRR